MRQALLALGAAALAACGQTTPASSTPQTAVQAPMQDAQFLASAAMYENYQIQAAAIAQAQAQSAAIRTYAANAAATHRAALQALTRAAQANGLPPPSGALNDDNRANLDQLREPGQTSFDLRYATQQALVTMSMAGRYDAFTSTAPDSPLKQWAASRSQAVHDDINAARQLALEAMAR